MSKQQQTLVFFGATGGCTANTLVHSLKAGENCIAMARTPQKLRTLLQEEHSVPTATLDQHLTVLQGNIMDEASIKSALTASGHLPDKIMYGIGGAPKFQASLIHPVTFDGPTVCGDGMGVLVSALKALQREGAALPPSGRRPVLVCVSTTGIDKVRDVPWLLIPLYKVALHVPHIDKKNMEATLFGAAFEKDPPLSGFTVIKPTLLTDGAAKPLGQIRAGWVWPDEHQGSEQAAGPQMGYTITRASVGLWVHENVIKGGNEWSGKCVSLA